MRAALLLLLLALPAASAAPHHHGEEHRRSVHVHEVHDHGGPAHDHAAAHDAHAPASPPSDPSLQPGPAPRTGPPGAGVGLAVGAGLALSALVAGYGSAAWHRLVPLAALFTRVGGTKSLKSPTRRRILAHLTAAPGAAIEEVAQALSLARGTAAYHLRVLDRAGFLVAGREGRTRRYAPPGVPATPLALRHPKGRALAEAARASPGSDRRTLAERLGLDPKLAHWHLARLTKAGALRAEREGRTVRYFAQDPTGP